MPQSRSAGARIRMALRLVAVSMILFGPIAQAAWDLRQTGPVGGTPAPDEEARYRSRRNPIIDQLLPSGHGGIRFVEHLDGKSGLAFLRTATIALAASVASDPWPGSVELHERAHLLDAFRPDLVSRLMAQLPPPRAGEYAAKDRGEHFAEMAASAWELVVAPDGVCIEGTLADRLRAAESTVPGTSGFVAWYLRHPALAHTDEAAVLRPIAESMITPQSDAWKAIWQALDSERLADGTFNPWRVQTVREYISRERAAARASGSWVDRVAALALAPSLVVLSIAGR